MTDERAYGKKHESLAATDNPNTGSYLGSTMGYIHAMV